MSFKDKEELIEEVGNNTIDRSRMMVAEKLGPKWSKVYLDHKQAQNDWEMKHPKETKKIKRFRKIGTIVMTFFIIVMILIIFGVI